MFKIYCKSSKFTLTALLRFKPVSISSAQWLTWPWLPDRIVQFWGGSAAPFSSSLIYSLARAIMVFGWCVEFILVMKPIISCVMMISSCVSLRVFIILILKCYFVYCMNLPHMWVFKVEFCDSLLASAHKLASWAFCSSRLTAGL